MFSLAGCGKINEIVTKLKSGKNAESLAQPRLEVSEVALQTKEKEILLEVEIANEPLERELGLMYRKALPKREADEVQTGMLFVFPYEETLKFWMRNTKIKLDIIFIDADRKIVGIVENAKPCKEDPCETYGPDASAKAILELPGGFAEDEGIAVGDSLELTLTPPSTSFDIFNPL